jgi:hypothetical protein
LPVGGVSSCRAGSSSSSTSRRTKICRPCSCPTKRKRREKPQKKAGGGLPPVGASPHPKRLLATVATSRKPAELRRGPSKLQEVSRLRRALVALWGCLVGSWESPATPRTPPGSPGDPQALPGKNVPAKSPKNLKNIKSESPIRTQRPGNLPP